MPYAEPMTLEEVSALLDYDPETGRIVWRSKTARKVVVGREAGVIKSTRTDKSGNRVKYRYIAIHGKSMPASRVAWLLHHGEWPLGRVMFKDGDALNLRAENLYLSNTMSGDTNHRDDGERADYMRAYRQDNPLAWKDSHLKSTFGIGLAEYAAMVALQGNKCAICDNPETEMRGGKVKALAVDHDHATGALRGLLCVACNTGLGKFGDDRNRLVAAIRYLDKHAGADTAASISLVEK